MPVTLTAAELVDALSSANDKTLLFQQEAFGDTTMTLTAAVNGTAAKSNTGGKVLPYQPLILDADIAVAGQKVELGYKTGNAAATRKAQGSVNIENGVQILASSLFGMEAIYRNFCQDPNPSYVYRGTGTSTFPAAATVVAAANAGNTTAVDHTVVAIPTAQVYPVRAKVTLSATPAINTTRGFATVTITGTDVNDKKISEEVRWTAVTPASKSTDFYFKTITKVTSIGLSAGKVAVTVQDKSTEITYTPKDLKVIDFLTLEYAYGGLVPVTYRDLIIESITANIARDVAVTYGVSFLGGIAGVRENVSDTGDTPTPTPSSGVTRASTDIFTGTESYVEINGVRVPITDATLTSNQGLINADYLNFSLFQTGKPRRNAKRTFQIQATLQASEQNDMQSLFLNNTIIEDVKFVTRAAAPGTTGLYPAQTEWHIETAEIMENPTLSSSGNSVIPQSVTFDAFNNEGDAEFEIVSSQPDYDKKLYRYS